MPRAPSYDPPAFTFRTQGWALGADSRDGINFLQPAQARPIENIVLNERGAAHKRLGCENHGTFGASGDRVLSMYTFYRGIGVQPQMLIHTTGGQLLYTNDPRANPATWALIIGGISNSVPLSFETFNSKVYFGNGVDSFASWNGTTYTNYPSAPKGRYHRLWKDTMWVSGVTGQNDRVYSSAAGDAETWPVANYIDVGRGDGDTVRALATDGQFLIVGKRDKTATIYDPVTLANRVVDYEKGFESHFAVAQYESETYFLSRRGICRYLGDSPSSIISDMLDPMFDPQVIALDRLMQATAYAFENRVGFALPEVGQTVNSVVIEYYPRLGALTAFGTRSIGPFTFHRMPTQCFARWRYMPDDQLFASHPAANKMLRVFANVGTDDGVSYKAVLQTPFFDLQDPVHTKYLNEIRMLCVGRFNVFVYRDYETSIYATIPVDEAVDQDKWDSANDIWGNGVWGRDPWIKSIVKFTDVYGRCFSFRFQDAQDTGTAIHLVWVGDQGKEVPMGEWAIYDLAGAGVVLGERS